MYKLPIILILSLASNFGYSNPLERYSNENIIAAKKLANELNNSEWLYSWRGRDYKIRFNDNGSIGYLEGWRDVKWFVSGKKDVVLESRTSRMILHFNLDNTAFYTRDWDGEKASGQALNK